MGVDLIFQELEAMAWCTTVGLVYKSGPGVQQQDWGLVYKSGPGVQQQDWGLVYKSGPGVQQQDWGLVYNSRTGAWCTTAGLGPGVQQSGPEEAKK